VGGFKLQQRSSIKAETQNFRKGTLTVSLLFVIIGGINQTKTGNVLIN